MTESDEDLISKRAYALWEQEGWPEGRHHEHWQQAAREFQEGKLKPSSEQTGTVSPMAAPSDSPDIAAEPLNQDDAPVAPKMRGAR